MFKTDRTRRHTRCLALLASLTLLSIGADAQQPAEQAEPPTPFVVIGQQRTGATLQYYVRLTRVTAKSVSVSPMLVDDHGRQYDVQRTPTIVGSPQGVMGLDLASPKDGRPTLVVAGIPETEDVAKPIGLRFSFQVPADAKPKELFVRRGALAVDVASMPFMPLLPAPQIEVGSQQPGLRVSITKIARAIESEDTMFMGLKAGLESLDKSYSTLAFMPLTSLDYESGDAWVIVFVSARNSTRSIAELPFTNITLTAAGQSSVDPRVLFGVVRDGKLVDWESQEITRTGVAILYLGNPITNEKILSSDVLGLKTQTDRTSFVNVPAGATVKLGLVFREKTAWWLERYLLNLSK